VHGEEEDVPNRVVVASAASRNDAVSMPLSGSILTSENDVLWVSNHVLPGGTAVVTILYMMSGRNAVWTKTKVSRGAQLTNAGMSVGSSPNQRYLAD
jgi:hypothetical protein